MTTYLILHSLLISPNWSPLCSLLHLIMVPVLEMQKPRVTEIQVRMDCQGCVHKIKKALHGINGIYDLYIDFPQQKLTIIGWADPETIVKAIRKTRKTVTICSHTELPDPTPTPTPPPPPQPTEQKPENSQPPPPPEAAENPPPPEPQPADQPPLAEPSPPKDQPPETPPPEASPPQTVTNTNPTQPPGARDVGEVHVIHHHPPDYGYRYGHGVRPHEPYHYTPMHVTHSYNTNRPSPYVTEHASLHPRQMQMQYDRMDYYNEEYRYNNNNNHGNENITAVFSDANPNACGIM